MNIYLIPTAQDSVYIVAGVPADWSIDLVQSGVDRFVNREWPCPMMTYNATRYSVHALRGRKTSRIYVRIALS